MRHTRQGCARGQKHGTLDREDPDLGDGQMWAATSHSGMKEQGRVPARRERNLKTIASSPTGCWCGLPLPHDVHDSDPFPWQVREALDAEAVKRLTDVLVRVSLAAGREGVGVAILCEKGVPKYVAPCEHVPLNEVRWYGSIPHVEKELPPDADPGS